MNELVVDRGPSPYLTNLELFCNGRSMTSVQGDGMLSYVSLTVVKDTICIPSCCQGYHMYP